MKSSITNEMIDIIKNDIATANTAVISQYEFMDCQCMTVGLVTIHKYPGGSYLYLRPEADKRYMKDWKEDVGQILLTDIKKNNLSPYYELVTQKTDPACKALLRRISDEEYDDFKAKGQVHLMIGDFYYIIIKLVPANDGYNFRDNVQYTPEEQVDTEEIEEGYDKSVEEDLQSISLF